MRTKQKIIPIAFVLSFLFVSVRSGMITLSLSELPVNAGTNEARAKLREAYNVTVSAEQAGTNVNEAVEKMNEALQYLNQAENLTAQGNLEQANALTQSSLQLSTETITLIEELNEQEGSFAFYMKRVLPVAAVVILLGVCAGALLFGQRLWKKRQQKTPIDVNARADNETMKNLSKDKDLHLGMNEEKMILVTVLSAIVVIAGILVYTSLTPPPQEDFVSIYILNSERKAYNYPKLIVLGKNNTFQLTVGAENFMNRIEYSVIQVEISNASQPEEPTVSFERILLNGEKWEIPVTMTLNKTGTYTITFGLWLYDEMKAVFTNPTFCNLRLEVISEI